MPGRHRKGEVSVPAFIASGTGRDLYLNPLTAAAPGSDDSMRAAMSKALQYTDIETGDRCTLRWWTRLPVAGEYKSRLKRQKAAASRFVLWCSTVQCCKLSQLPPIEKAFEKAQRSQTSLGFSRTGRVDRWEKLALEKFNPWSPHQTALRNYAAVYGMQKKPDRFDSNAMLAMTGGLTDLRA